MTDSTLVVPLEFVGSAACGNLQIIHTQNEEEKK